MRRNSIKLSEVASVVSNYTFVQEIKQMINKLLTKNKNVNGILIFYIIYQFGISSKILLNKGFFTKTEDKWK